MTWTALRPDGVREQVERILGPVPDWRLASDTNSQVWQVSTMDGLRIVKVLTDTSSDVMVERQVLTALGPRRARPIMAVVDLADGGKLVIAPYLDGEVMADRLRRGRLTAASAASLARQYDDLLTAVAALPLPCRGYGRVGSGQAAGHRRWSDALRAYLADQRRKGPRTAAACHARLAGVLDRLADRLDAGCGQPRLIPTDVNNRNFLLTPDGCLVALNLPVIWQGDPVMPYGVLQLHLDDTPVADLIAGRAPSPEPWRVHFYAAYHAFVIAVYVERFGSTPVETAPPWGRERPVLDLFDLHLRHLEELW